MKSHQKIILGVITIVTSLFILSGCASTNSTNSTNTTNPTNTTEATSAQSNEAGTYKTITAKEAKKMMDSGNPFVLVDVRTQDEFDEKHIEGALLIPNESIGAEMPSQLPDKDAVILIYCRSGNRSQQASEKLVALGYKNIYDFGGIIDWPYETVGK